MTEALNALRELAALSDSLKRKPSLPETAACARQAQALFGSGDAIAVPPSDVLAAIRRELQQTCAAGGAATLPIRTLRRAPLVFWDREPYAAALPGLVDAFFEAASRRDRLLREVIEAWFRDFWPDLPRFSKSGEVIAALVSRSLDPRLAFWANASNRYAIFDAQRGPQNVGSALLSGAEGTQKVLADVGMDNPLRAAGRFFRAAVLALLHALPKALQRPDAAMAFDRAAEILEVRQPTQDRIGRMVERPVLRFPDLAGETISAMLSPWLPAPQGPHTAPKDVIKAFLMRVIGDPRLYPDRWKPAPEECARLMRSWLAEASLETFFDLISEKNDDPQWRYRRAFWRACLRKMPKDQPGEVWVILGPGMAARAKAVRDLANGYGSMDASGQYGEQAVLLIRLGNIILSEWSNVGPVRAWLVGDRKCPPLYRSRYAAADLRAQGMDFPDHPRLGRGGAFDGKGLWHRSPQTGLWQGCAAQFLATHVDLHLTEQDYMRP
jgi:hypothetical protein